MTTISSDLPAGNIRVIKQEEYSFLLSEEQRDSAQEWFYWKFRAIFEKPGHYTFRFEHPNKVGTRSAAISLDRGKSWHWLSADFYSETQAFSYDCKRPEEVWFCQAIPYLQEDFIRFSNEFSNHPAFHLESLCKSRKGRAVELVTICEGNPHHAILLTSRHHCQEMAATHALEGFLRAVLSNDDFGNAFRREFSLFVVPFVDKDGVEDGDQGKGRVPRDHGRDYYGDSIYPETRAIRELIEREKPFLLLDLHCPWIRFGSTNEQSYIVENAVPRFQAEIARLSRLLQKYSTPEAPFRDSNKVRWGVSWNCTRNHGTGPSYGKGLANGNAHHSFIRLACTIEIPFANFGETTMTRRSFLRYGASIAHAAYEFGLKCYRDRQSDTATLCLTGALGPTSEFDSIDSNRERVCESKQLFSRISSELQSADCCVSHLLTSSAILKTEKCNLFASDHSLSAFAEAIDNKGFLLVSTAPDHCLENEIDEMLKTLDMLDRLGVEHTGTFRSPEEHNKPLIRYVNGFRIAFVATAFGFSAPLGPQESFVANVFNPHEKSELSSDIRARIADARNAGAEYVVALLQTDGLDTTNSNAHLESFIRSLLDAGSDMIFCNQSGCIRKFAWMDGHPVFYGLGNLFAIPILSVDSQPPEPEFDSVMVRPVFSRDENGKVAFVKASFKILHYGRTDDKGVSITPLYHLIENATSLHQRNSLSKRLQNAVRSFLDLSQDEAIVLKPEYDLPGCRFENKNPF